MRSPVRPGGNEVGIKRLGILATGLMLAACAQVPVAPAVAKVTSETSHTYYAPDADAVGLIRVFDDGRTTYLQFEDLDLDTPVVASDQGPLPVVRRGEYLLVSGIYPRILVRARDTLAVVVNDAYTPPPVVMVARSGRAKPDAAPREPARKNLSALSPRKPATATAGKAKVAATKSTGSGGSGKAAGKTLSASSIRHPKPIAPPVLPHLDLMAGESLSTQLVRFGHEQGWTVLWNLPSDWIVPANTRFSGRVPDVVKAVVVALDSAGIDAHADLYLNNVAVIHPAAVTR